MNICFVTTVHVAKYRGGVERVTDTLAKEFSRIGHTVYLISLLQPKLGDEIISNQYFLPSQDINSLVNKKFLVRFMHEKDINIIINQSELWKILDLLSYAAGIIPIISVVHTDPAGILKGKADIWDLWRYQHGLWKFMFTYPYWWLRKQYKLHGLRVYTQKKLRHLVDLSSVVVLLSEHYIPIYRRLAILPNSSKLFSIPNSTTFPTNNATVTKEKIILFVGRLDFQKRLDRLLKVWRDIKDHQGWRIVVLGDGDYRSQYKQLCQEYELTDIVFEGTVNPKEYYQKAEILCLTSSHEGFGMVILEGLIYGVIPIAFNSYESLQDLINDGKTGFMIPPFSVKQYRECLYNLMTNDNLRKYMRTQICHFIAENHKFETNSVVSQWINLFEVLKKSDKDI